MLKHRLPSALLLAGTVFLILFFDGFWGQAAFIVLGVLVSGLATAEFVDLLAPLGLRAQRRWTVGFAMAGFALPVILAEYRPFWLVPAFALWAFSGLVVAWVSVLKATDRQIAVRAMVVGASCILLVFLPLHCLTFIYVGGEGTAAGRHALLFLLAVTKCGDIGGYVAGTLTARLMPGGNHKMTPRLSPKKSWEGTVGGLLLSMLVAWALRGFLPLAEGDQTGVALLIGVFFYAGGLLGDLSISALKRAADVKDSGNLIPGMGGVLDVVDSLLLNAPLALLLLLLHAHGG
jgi:phosphatidate cytidylyltransferase